MEILLSNRKKVPDENEPQDWIHIEEASEHNLKNVSTKIPRNRFVVFTGLSGSGKSSLAIDTLFKEGQRRFVESLSSYARQFLGQIEKPKVKSIRGLSPAISIDQKTASSNPRSTVGTITEINDYLRILFSSIGTAYCPKCDKEITGLSSQEIVEKILTREKDTRFEVIAPIVIQDKGTFMNLFKELKKEGYNRLIVDGDRIELDEGYPDLKKNFRHDILAVIDRLTIKDGIEVRLNEAVETSLRRAEGRVRIDYFNGKNVEEVLYTEHAGCLDCGIFIGELNPRMFSFNSPIGACENCTGLGFVMDVDPDLLIESKHLSINEGAIKMGKSGSGSSWTNRRFESILKHYGFDLDTPIQDLSEKAFNSLFYGSEEPIRMVMEDVSGDRKWKYETERKTEGIVNTVKRRYEQTNSMNARRFYEKFMAESDCPYCNGDKLKNTSLGVRVNNSNIIDITKLSVIDALDFFSDLRLDEREMKIAAQVFQEIHSRLQFMSDVGLDYLTLDRKASTLSGGEAQRIRLATQIGSKLVGVLYVLDEPSIGLHARDNERLLRTFHELRDLGNTVVVIEHDEETIRAADYILDIGPLAGVHGGEIVAQGTPEDIAQVEESITGKYLRKDLAISYPEIRRSGNGEFIELYGVQHNNLKNIDVRIPLGVLNVISGVSGSGKSSLVDEVLWKVLAREFHGATDRPGKYDSIEGLEFLDKVIMIDQSPIGRTPRSNPATYTKVFDVIRDLFASLPSAKVRGYDKGRFSFNVKGGRCEACSGNGYNKIDMSFLGDVEIICDVCKGKRYNKDTLDINYKGKNIAEVLQMTIEEGLAFFKNVPKAREILQTLMDVGCSYIRLGQSSTTLSGGEAQRIKLSRELSKRVTGNTLILLDEPTTGLAIHDVSKLLEVLHRLVNNGNTVLCIEHNLDIIKNADNIIDLGPEGGEFGGEIVAQGTPEMIIKSETSFTGDFLKDIL